MADPHSTFEGSRLGSENTKTLAKNNKEGQQNEFINTKLFHRLLPLPKKWAHMRNQNWGEKRDLEMRNVADLEK